MATLLIASGAFVFYLLAYHSYGRWLSRKVFRLDPDAAVPSVALNDDRDYVPTSKAIVFGHHFTSIAGTGPIVGPAIAVMWGWLPALLWVLLGAVFIGAVQDLGALVISLRNHGQTVGDIAGRVLNPRVRVLFLCILFVALTIVLAIFGLVIAAVFKTFPAAIFPCLVQVPLAIGIGVWLHRQGANLLVPSIIALALMYVSVIYGDVGLLGQINAALASWSILSWVIVLLAYSYVASVLPVWTLLQPRDFINSLQLLTALALVLCGLIVAAFIGGAPAGPGGGRVPLELVAPWIEVAPAGAPMIFPFLFITIACGAVSGFHCLVSSGTSSKQLKCETDAQMVGYGSMLTEGFLATLVILSCCAGLGLGAVGPDGTVLQGKAAWLSRYASWGSAAGLKEKVSAFVDGAANFLAAMSIPPEVAVALMGVLVASFAGTTLDTACRLQRYVVQELASTFARRRADGAPGRAFGPLAWLQNRHGATLLAIGVAAIVAALPAGGASWSFQNAGKGGLLLWPMFGATNQLLGGLAFLVIAFWLWRRRLPVAFAVLPMVFMLTVSAVALVGQLSAWVTATEKNGLLIGVASVTLLLEVWMLFEAVLLWPKVKGVLEETLPPLPRGNSPPAVGAHADGGRSC